MIARGVEVLGIEEVWRKEKAMRVKLKRGNGICEGGGSGRKMEGVEAVTECVQRIWSRENCWLWWRIFRHIHRNTHQKRKREREECVLTIRMREWWKRERGVFGRLEECENDSGLNLVWDKGVLYLCDSLTSIDEVRRETWVQNINGKQRTKIGKG